MRAQRVGLEAAALGVAGEHAVEVAGPQAGLVPSGAGADLDDHVLVVVGVALDHREPDLLREHLHALAGGLHLGAQLGVVAALGEHLPRALGVGLRMPPLLGELGRGGQLVEEASGLRVALAVPDHLGIRHLRLRLLEPGLDLLDERLDHPIECMAAAGDLRPPAAPSRRQPLRAAAVVAQASPTSARPPRSTMTSIGEPLVAVRAARR